MNIRLLAIALSGAVMASAAPAMGATTVEVWTTDTTPTLSSPRVIYYEQTPRVVYIEGTPRYYDADGNRVYTRDVYSNDWSNRVDAYDPRGRGMSPAEVSNLTHNVDSTTSGVPWSGSGAQPGNMGPANSKGQ